MVTTTTTGSTTVAPAAGRRRLVDHGEEAVTDDNDNDRAMKYIRKEEEDNDRWTVDIDAYLRPDMIVDEADARSIVNFLKQDKIDNPERPGACLNLDHARFTDEALDVLCHSLQELDDGETFPVSGVFTSKLEGRHFVRLLKAMHTNTSVKRLKVSSQSEMDDSGAAGDAIGELLQHKTDFHDINFSFLEEHVDSWALALPQGLRHGQPQLKRLKLFSCYLGDEGVASIVDALVEAPAGGFDSLEVFSFYGSCITPKGLESLSRLIPAVVPNLKILHIDANRNLLDDALITKRFADSMLLSNNTTLEELWISGCSTHGLGYAVILKALKDNRKLLRLMMKHACYTEQSRELVRAQLIQTLPEMKGLRYLDVDKELFNEAGDTRRDDLKMAFFKNTTLLKLKAE